MNETRRPTDIDPPLPVDIPLMTRFPPSAQITTPPQLIRQFTIAGYALSIFPAFVSIVRHSSTAFVKRSVERFSFVYDFITLIPGMLSVKTDVTPDERLQILR